MSISGRQGQPAVITVHWADAGTDADVTNLTIRIVGPDAVVVIGPTATGIQHISTGVYLYIWTVNPALAAGDYTVVWSADVFSGPPGSQTLTDTVSVAAVFGAAYVTVAQVKDAMQIKNTRQDNQIALNCVAASRAIDRRCGQGFYRDLAVSTRQVDALGRVLPRSGGAVLLTPPIAIATGLLYGTTELQYGPSGCLERGEPITELWGVGWDRYSRYDITAVWGWPSVPPDIESATLLQATRLTRRPASPEGVAGSAEWGLVRIPNLDPDVRAMIEPFRLPGIA